MNLFGKILLILSVCSYINAEDNTVDLDNKLVEIFSCRYYSTDEMSKLFKIHGYKKIYEKLLIPVIKDLKSNPSSLIFIDDWQQVCGFTLDDFQRFAKENNIKLNNINLNKCKNGQVVYSTTINLDYPLVNVQIQYRIAEDIFNNNEKCVDFYYKLSNETSKIVMYKVFSNTSDKKHIEFRNWCIRNILEMNGNDFFEKDDQRTTSSDFFLKIVETIDYYGMNFLNNFIKIIINDNNFSNEDKQKIFKLFIKYYKENPSNNSEKYCNKIKSYIK